MGMRSWAKIEFPFAMIDEDIREFLERQEGVRFQEDGSPDDLEGVKVKSGLFCLEDNEAEGGEFEDLETMLVHKGIPFDRETGADWNCPPVLRVFRPGGLGIKPSPYPMDITIPLDFEGDPVVKVAAIREVASMGIVGAVRNYLDKHFPAYPPLAAYVTEEKNETG